MGRPPATATERAERARETAKQAIGRELLYAGILARLWPSWVLKREPLNESEKKWGIWWVLAVETPAGWITRRLSPEEAEGFDWVPQRPYAGERIEDPTPILMALVADGSWVK